MSIATLQLAGKAFFITPTTLSLGCHSWPEHEVRLSIRFCDGLMCSVLQKLLLLSYVMSCPVDLAYLETAQHSITTVL